MGLVKEYMHESWNQVEIKVSFVCEKCGHFIPAIFKITDEESEAAETMCCYNRECNCSYTILIGRAGENYFAKLPDFPEINVSFEVDDRMIDWDEWLEPDPEPGAYAIFKESMKEWRYEVEEIGDSNGGSARNRMLFSMLYSTIEAYFSDEMIGIISSNQVAKAKIVDLKYLNLQDNKFCLGEILKNPTLVRDKIRARLQSISFHNLTLVDKISKDVFGKGILPSEKDLRDGLVDTIKVRHDCVHRNGLDVEGRKHTHITKELLLQFGEKFEIMAKNLRDAIADFEANCAFTPIE